MILVNTSVLPDDGRAIRVSPGEWRLMLPQFRTLGRDRDARRLQCPLGQLGPGVLHHGD